MKITLTILFALIFNTALLKAQHLPIEVAKISIDTILKIDQTTDSAGYLALDISHTNMTKSDSDSFIKYCKTLFPVLIETEWEGLIHNNPDSLLKTIYNKAIFISIGSWGYSDTLNKNSIRLSIWKLFRNGSDVVSTQCEAFFLQKDRIWYCDKFKVLF
jgi:hypothetical protein